MDKQKMMTDEQIEQALNQCAFGIREETRCKDCPYNDGSPCITNLYLDTLKYIEKLKANALPFKIGDKAYVIYDIEGIFTVVEREIVGVKKLEYNDGYGYSICAIVRNVDNHNCTLYYDMDFYNKEWWTDKAVAEQELKKLLRE